MWAILGFASLVLVGAFVQRQRLRAWQDLATSCGLEVVQVSTSKLVRVRLEARAGPARVCIESGSAGKGYGVQVLATFPRPPGVSSSLKIRRRREAEEAHDLKIGDELFDSRFSVEGSTRLKTLLFDEEMRRLFLGVPFEGELEVSGSEIRLVTFDGKLRQLLPLLLVLIRRLAEPEDAVQRLAWNARQDSAAGVRLRNLLALIREHPGEARTAEALHAACSDPDPRIRLQAARQLGAERRDVLFELAESLEDDAVSAEAVTALGRELASERAQSILSEALRRRRLRSARACLRALGTSGDAATVEPLLLQALGNEDGGVQEAAAVSLGRVGTALAVQPLLEAAGRSSLGPALRGVMRQAVAAIQSRLEGAVPGQLSLAPSEGGQLSLASSEAGRLSLEQAEAGPGALAVEPFPLPPGEPVQSSRMAREVPAGRPV